MLPRRKHGLILSNTTPSPGVPAATIVVGPEICRLLVLGFYLSVSLLLLLPPPRLLALSRIPNIVCHRQGETLRSPP